MRFVEMCSPEFGKYSEYVHHLGLNISIRL